MMLMKLSPEQIRTFEETPEAAMGVHIARAGHFAGMILSGRVLALPSFGDDEASERLANELWFGRRAPRFRDRAEGQVEQGERQDAPPIGRQIEREDELIEGLGEAPDVLRPVDPTDARIMGFILNPPGYLPPTPARPATIYGHLPFTGTIQAGDVFYRCEHWLTSRRCSTVTGEVLAGTYGFPASELSFVPTGFAAVGRYALPDLPPACRRYQIQPSANYVLQCGACVPLYGQAGGGVEVMFPSKFIAVGGIPAPTILPAL